MVQFATGDNLYTILKVQCATGDNLYTILKVQYATGDIRYILKVQCATGESLHRCEGTVCYKYQFSASLWRYSVQQVTISTSF